MLLTEIEGIIARIEANDVLFEKYLADSYGPAVRHVGGIEDSGHPDLEVNIRFEKAYGAEANKWVEASFSSNPTVLGSFLRVGHRSILYQYAPLNIVAEWSDSSLHVETLFEMTRKFRAYRRLQHSRIFTSYQEVMRRSVHFPYFLLLGQRGYSLLHAAMSCKDEDAILFMGLNGAGKTTAALSLLPELRIAADNFVIFDGDKAFGYPEFVRIPGDIPAEMGLDGRTPVVNGKFQVKMGARSGIARVRPRACVIVKRGKENSLEETPRDEAIAYLEAVDLFEHETHDYSYLSFIRRYPSKRIYPKCEFYTATVCGREGSRSMIRKKVGDILGLRL